MPVPPSRATLLAALFLAATAGRSQTFHVSPGTLAAVEGPAGDDYPFAVPVCRYQQIHDDLTERALLGALACRRDGGRTTPMQAWTVELELFLGTARQPAATMTNTFAANRGQDFTLVLPRQKVAFPALPLASPLPCPFLVDLPFAQAFPFRAQGSLLWEAAVHGNAQGSGQNLKVFNYLDAQAPILAKGEAHAFGQGCQGSGGKIPLLDAWLRNDGYFRATLQGAPALAPGLMVFGASDTRWFIVPLPWDLGPLGAPGCTLLADVVVLWPLAVDALGAAALQFGGVPLTSEMAGLPIFLQGLLTDPPANALGVVSSQGMRLLVPPPRASTGVSRLYSLDDLQAAQGLRDLGYGLVVRLTAR